MSTFTKNLLNIGERAASMFLISYGASASVLAGGFGTRHDLQIAAGAALGSLVKNLAALVVSLQVTPAAPVLPALPSAPVAPAGPAPADPVAPVETSDSGAPVEDVADDSNGSPVSA